MGIENEVGRRCPCDTVNTCKYRNLLQIPSAAVAQILWTVWGAATYHSF